jgi:DNA-binding response OmpR family regulator
MPQLSGLDVLARIRADERLKSLPCIILTAAGQEQQHRRAIELGASEFMTKPFSPKKLYARAAELTGLVEDEATTTGGEVA